MSDAPEPWQLLSYLGVEVRARELAHQDAVKVSGAAIKRAGEANAHMLEALMAYRNLASALVGHAGHERAKDGPSVDQASEDAWAILETAPQTVVPF